jgi:hypothetical protein
MHDAVLIDPAIGFLCTRGAGREHPEKYKNEAQFHTVSIAI